MENYFYSVICLKCIISRYYTVNNRLFCHNVSFTNPILLNIDMTERAFDAQET